MTYYEKKDVSKRIDNNETGASKECGICHY